MTRTICSNDELFGIVVLLYRTEGTSMARVGIISVDGHVKAPWAAYRGYLDPAVARALR